MINGKSNKPKPKNKIASRIRKRTALLFILILVPMTVVLYAAVVIFHREDLLPNMKIFLSSIFVMAAVLFIYVVCRNIMLNILICKPLERLTQDLSEGKLVDEDFYGKYRNDEIGELARIIRNITNVQQRQEELLYAVNRMTAVLMTQVDDKNFEDSLMEGMEIIGRCVDVDRIHVWRNEIVDGVLCYVRQVQWQSEIGRQQFPVPEIRPCSKNPEWERKFSRNESVNGPFTALTQQEQEILVFSGVKSILAIPLYIQEQFYGFFSFDDCHQERTFSGDEIEILRTAGLMIVSAMHSNTLALEIRQVNEYSQILLDAMPMTCHLWDSDSKLFYCNEESLKLFKVEDKQDYIERFFEFSPKYQPDGKLSSERAQFYIKKALDEGGCVFEWMHQLLDGTLLPMEISLARVKLMGKNVVACYGRDLREYKKMTQEIQDGAAKLEAALEEARKANDAKSRFLTNMSHEMRTPLNAIIGLSELTIRYGKLDEESFMNLERISNAGITLLALINDILDISKIEAGKLDIIPVEYETPSMLNDSISQSILHKGEKPIKFILNIDENLPSRLYGDDLRVKQIFNNLLSNAFKYTKKGIVELSVSFKREGDSVWLIALVRDTGNGIRREDIQNLFINYTQTDTFANRKIVGTGLGLSISKRLAEMMDGSISVESEYGEGSIFTARLRQEFVTDTVIGQEVVDSLMNFRYSDQRRQRDYQMTRVNMSYARVLVVDDMVTNLDVTKGMMKAYSLQVDCVTSGQEAIDAIRDEKVKYNAVFMDHMMPEMDGIEAVRIIREEIGTQYAKTVPIIALTANAIVGNEEMFLSKGFQAFISKPIDPKNLDKILHTWIVDKQSEETLLEAEEAGAELDAKKMKARQQDNLTIFKDASVKGVDFIQGIERFNDEEAYLDVIRSYHLHTPGLLKKLKPFTQAGGELSLHEYGVIVHGLKGASDGICANAAAREAERLEEAAKNGDIEFVTAKNIPFITMVESLLSDLGVLLQGIAGCRDVKKEAQAPDANLLADLLKASKGYKASMMEHIMGELESYEYKTGGDLVVWLREQMDNLEYDAISERLESLPTAH